MGFSFGVGFFGLGISWVFIAIYVFGSTSIGLATLLTALFVGVLSLFFALIGYVLQRFFPEHSLPKVLIVYPALWALCEFIRSTLFTGFPWLLLGHSLAGSHFGGFVPILGVYGSSFLMVFMSSLFLVSSTPFWNSARSYHWVISNVALLCLAVLVISSSVLMIHEWTKPTGDPLSVSLQQGNIPQQLRWDAKAEKNIIDTYVGMAKNHLSSALIIWPEAAIPMLQEQAQPLLLKLNNMLLQHHSALITGIIEHDNDQYYNAAITLGNASGDYKKRHLVPFGEYVPFEKLLRGVIGFFNLPMSNLSPAVDKQNLIHAQNIPLALFVCYEIAYGSIVRDDLPEAQMLVTISDDAWFGKSLAPWQHMQIAQFQALATGRPLLMVGNTGLTAVINHQGFIQNYIPAYMQMTLNDEVRPFTGSTFWVAWGDWPWLSLMVFGVLAVFVWRRARSKIRAKMPSS